MAGYIGAKAVGLNVTTGDILGDVGVGGDVTATTSDGALLLLQSSDTTITDGSVLGGITFNAPNEASGTDAILVGAAIEAVAEGTFAADNNATELVFKTGASAAADQKMTLTSGGNFLVGGTSYEGSSSSNASSAYIGSNGFISANVTNDYGMQVNRTGTDGALFNGRKNGSDVGSIGTSGADLTIGTGDTGLKFFDGGDSIFPVTQSNGNNRDSAVDLGYPSVRFKDLYLSGGAFIGGAVAANKLDDYEEGVYTATITPSSSGSIGLSSGFGSYTKIGNLVTVNASCSTNAINSPVGYFTLNLPFTCNNTNQNGRSAATIYIDGVAGNQTSEFIGLTIENTTECRIYLGDATVNVADSAQRVDASTYILISVTYRVA